MVNDFSTFSTFAELLRYIKALSTAQLQDKAVIYKIGKLHKTLPKSQRNWNELSRAIVYASSNRKGPGEGLRQFVLTQERKETFAAPEDVVHTSKDTQPTSTSVAYDYEEFYKQKTQVRDIYNAYRASLRDEARVDALKESVVSAASSLNNRPIKLDCTVTGDTSGEAILLLSDWHIGQVVNNFYNTYDLDVAKRRVSQVVQQAIKNCRLLNVARLNVLNLGDLIEGIINVTGRVNQQTDVVSQLTFASELLAQALCELQTAAPEVVYRSCTDNHSRLLADKKQNIAVENLTRITDWWLETRMAGTNVRIAKDNLDAGLGKFVLLNGMNVAFFHGHEDSKSQILQNVVGATHEWIDIVCCGHWHNPAEHTFQNMRLYINNSLCGTGDYALSRRLFTKPSQKLIVVKDHIFMDIDIVVD